MDDFPGGMIAQTNIDHWSESPDEDILWSVERRRACFEAWAGKGLPNVEEMWTVYSEEPIFNDLTVYACFMRPKDGILVTRIPVQRSFLSQRRDCINVVTGIFIPQVWLASFVLSFSSPPLFKKLPLPPQGSSFEQELALKLRPPNVATCPICGATFNVDDNPAGHCGHVAKWHSQFSDCSYVRCGFHLARKGQLFMQHWGCCFECDENIRICSKSGPHTTSRSQVVESGSVPLEWEK